MWLAAVHSSVMHLYIISGRINIDVSDVALVDGYRPSVGGYRPSTAEFEPAIWFKVMVLDAITIDCDDRRLSWVPLCNASISNFAALNSGIAFCGTYRLSSGSADDDQLHLIDCSDDTLCGQLREVFDVVPDLVARYESNEMMREDFNKALMQLLHVHVLPSIRLTVHDLDCILACIHTLEVIIDKIDKDIREVAEKIRLAEQSHAGLRRKMLCRLMADDRKDLAGAFSMEFTDQLLRGTEKDIESAWTSVEYAQGMVEKLKHNPEANDAELIIHRAKRDVATAEYESLLASREKLKEIKRSKRGLVKRVRDVFAAGAEDPEHKIYVRIVTELNKFEELNQIITHNKLLATSVKEAARLAASDLRSGNDSFGVEFDSVGAAHSTDVLGGNIKAPWQSIAEQIASILANDSHQIARLHRDFCRHIADVCSAAAVEKRLYDESVQALLSSSNNSPRLDNKACNSLTHSCSSGSISELELDLSGSAFRASGCVSLPGDQLVKSAELPRTGAGSQEATLGRSLPVMQTDPEDSSSGDVLSMRSLSVSSSQKVSPKLEGRSNIRSRRKMKSSTLAQASFKSYVPYGLISLSQMDSGQDSPVIVLDTSRDCIQTALELVRKEILIHFETISTQLQQELASSSSRSLRQQVWLDYESHFYQEMMAPLIKLYQLKYANITDAFCSSLLELTSTDLSLDEAVLLYLLQDPRDESVCSFESGTLTASESSLENVSRSVSLDRTSVPLSFDGSSESQADVNSEADDLSRLLRSHSEESRRPPLRTVRISLPVIVMPHSPTSVLVYERKLAPLPCDRDSIQSNSHMSLSAKTMALKPHYLTLFSGALQELELAIEARTPCSKLRHLTDCLRETTKQLAAFYAELYGDSSSQLSGDEILDAVVILLCNVDGRQMALLYCQLALLADLMAPWLLRGHYAFSLVQFFAACQFIQERLMLKRNRQHILKQTSATFA